MDIKGLPSRVYSAGAGIQQHRTGTHGDQAGDDNGTWLITLADLMTMLLVFALIMFASLHATKNTPAPQAPAAPSSMVSVALANTKHPAPQSGSIVIPLRLRESLPLTAQPQPEERIICRMPLAFQEGSLAVQPGHKPDLKQIACLAGQNPAAKIIITAGMAGQTGPAFARAMNIMRYLVSNCAIPEQRVFLQSCAASSTQEPAASEQGPVEVKLIKSFWWF